MRRVCSRLHTLPILVMVLGMLASLPPAGSAEPATLQAMHLAYPLSRRFLVTSHFDHTPPWGATDNRIQIYTGATVNAAGTPPPHCDVIGTINVCTYSDGDTNLWDPRWDQDHDDHVCGPGWLWYDGHPGYDLSCPDGTPVNAANVGTVQVVDAHTLFVYDGTSRHTGYYHLSAQTVGDGASVQTGQQIGNTGSGHLHFKVEYWSNGAWNPVDPYGWEQGNLWAGGDPIPMGYRDRNNTVHGPFQLDRPKIRDKWVAEAGRLGSPIEDDFSYGCTEKGTEAIGYIQGFERGYIYYCGSGAAQVTFYTRTFLPSVRAAEVDSDWQSFIEVRNLNPNGSATVNVTFYGSGGWVLDSRTYEGLPGNATWEANVHNILAHSDDPTLKDFLDRNQYDPFFDGSAVVSADQDVAVVVRTKKSPNGVVYHTAYSGISNSNAGSGWGQPGSAIYVPSLYWNPYWGGGSQWRSTIHVQNAGSGTANFSITYSRMDGSAIGTYNHSLAIYGQGNYPVSQFGDNFVGSAYVQSDQPLAVVVSTEDVSTNNWGAYQSNVFASGSSTVYLPHLIRNLWNWNSSFIVQNVGTAPTTVQVTYCPESGNPVTCATFSLAAGTSHMVTQNNPKCLFPSGQQGSAVVSSNNGQPLVANVEMQLDMGSSQRSADSYSGLLGGGTLLYGPFAARNSSFTTSSHVQNVGSASATGSRSYFWTSGSSAPGGGSWSTPIAPRRAVMFWLPAEGVPSDFIGSVRFTVASSLMGGIHYVVIEPNNNDFAAGYNMSYR